MGFDESKKRPQECERSGAQIIGSFLREKRLASRFETDDVIVQLELGSTVELFEYETGQREIPLQLLFEFSNLYSIPPDQLVLLLYKQALRK